MGFILCCETYFSYIRTFSLQNYENILTCANFFVSLQRFLEKMIVLCQNYSL